MTGESLSRMSAWPVVICYVLALGIRMCARFPVEWRTRWYRSLWTLGWVLLATHVAIAFVSVHHGDWQAVLDHTRQRTFEMTGWNSDTGAWLNLATLVIWGSDVACLWLPPRILVRCRLLHRFNHILLAFMMVNATVVFGSRAAQWLAVTGVVGGIVVWFTQRSRASA